MLRPIETKRKAEEPVSSLNTKLPKSSPPSSPSDPEMRNAPRVIKVYGDPHVPNVLRLQRKWRSTFRFLTTRRIVEKYFATGPTVEHVKSISFQSLVVLLREKPIIAVAKAALQRIHLLSTFRHGSPSKALAPENVNVRVFLAGFMIAYRPTHVFESMGSLEQALLEAATPLLTTFQKICECIRGSESHSFQDVPHELTKDFPTMLFEYLKRFKAWKVPDERKLTCRIKHALIALYQAEEHLPPDEPEDSKLKVEFRTQIERLRSKLLQIAGSDALREFDEQRAAGNLPGGGDDHPGGGGGGSGSGGSGAYASLPGRMSNEQLAHELLIDPFFQLDESGGCSTENPVFHRIREAFHQAFWDSLADDMRLEMPCYVRVLRVLSEIRDGICDLAGSREAGSVAETIDLDHIKQQAEAGLYSWKSSTSLIHDILQIVQRVQAPRRDDETKTKWSVVQRSMQEAVVDEQPRVLCSALEFLLDRVNAMRIDAANARLRLIAPVIKDHGIDYERGKFQDKLKAGSLTLERTRAWVRLTVRREVGSKAVDRGELEDGKASAFIHVHAVAMLHLVTEQQTMKADICPETLLFDVHRLSMLQFEFRYQAMAVTVMTTATHHIVQQQADTAVLADIQALLADESKTEAGAIVEQICELLTSKTSLSESGRMRLVNALHQCIEPGDAVHQLIAQRLRTYWAKIMMEGRVPASPTFLRSSLLLVPRIEKAATKLMALTNLNRTVHLPTYNDLIKEEAQSIDTA